jgi:hypothetical protein
MGLEPAIPAGERPQAYALYHAAIEIGNRHYTEVIVLQ